jgi:hypothetical protein
LRPFRAPCRRPTVMSHFRSSVGSPWRRCRAGGVRSIRQPAGRARLILGQPDAERAGNRLRHGIRPEDDETVRRATYGYREQERWREGGGTNGDTGAAPARLRHLPLSLRMGDAEVAEHRLAVAGSSAWPPRATGTARSTARRRGRRGRRTATPTGPCHCGSRRSTSALRGPTGRHGGQCGTR